MEHPVLMLIEAHHFCIEERFEMVPLIAFYTDYSHLLMLKRAGKNNKEKKAEAETEFVASFQWNCSTSSFADFHTF